jgi:hypothetical protein
MAKLTKSPKNTNNQDKQHNLIRNAIASLLILQALFIGVKGNHELLSGKSPLDVISWMLTQSIELLIKAKGLQDKTKQ